MLGLFIMMGIVDEIHAQAVSNIEQQIDMTSEEISDFIEGKHSAATALANNSAKYIYENPTPEGFGLIAKRLRPFCLAHVFDNVFVADTSGTAYGPDGKQVDVRNVESYQKSISGETVISRPFDFEHTGKQMFVICVPIKHEGEVVGALCALQNTEKFVSILTRDFYHGKGFCHLVSDDGDVLVRSGSVNADPTLINLFDKIMEEKTNGIKTEQTVNAIKADFAGDKKGIQTVPLSTGNRMVGYQAIGGMSGWNIVGVVRQNDLWEVSKNLIIEVVGLTMGAVIIMLVLVIFLNLSRKNARIKLERAAYFDEVTGGFNYSAFLEQAPVVLKENRQTRFMLLYLDIDLFKTFNNSFGHDVGDKLLKRLYERLLSFGALNGGGEKAGEIAARINGDSFVLLCRDTPENADISWLTAYIGQSCADIGVEYSLKFSVGVYRIENPSEPIDQMMDKAELAKQFYEKNRLEHSCFYDPGLMKKTKEDLVLEAAMGPGLENGEFAVWIQPKVDTLSQRVVGGEALIRWDSKEFGMLTPFRFIPLFEKNGFIRKIDFYVLDKVCQCVKDQLDQGASPVPISINQSRHHVFSPFYLNQLEQTVNKYDIPHDLIEFEVTESMLLENMEKVIENIVQIRKMGFRVAIDDFGTGFTSLRFLQEVDVDDVKMDRSLIVGAQQNEKNFTMLYYLTDMSHALGMKVVCEGVETIDQLEMVREIGADVIQGYYFAKPMPWPDFLSYLEEHS